MRQAQAGGAKPAATRVTGEDTVRQRVAPPSAPAATAGTVRPAFPVFSVHRATAEYNRILLPDAPGQAEAPAGAAYRMLRTRFVQRLRNNRWTSLAITSPGAGEGKSVTTLNLALNMARDKANDVFVLDLDLRNPSICRFLGVEPPRELVSYLAGAGEPQETFFSIGLDNLAIAGCTTPTHQASELVATGRVEELIAYITSISPGAIVLIDLPPLLVTDEALLIAPRVDATALVVAEGRTRRDSLARARQLLADFSFAGVILNCSSESFGADSYYGYGSRYST